MDLENRICEPSSNFVLGCLAAQHDNDDDECS